MFFSIHSGIKFTSLHIIQHTHCMHTFIHKHKRVKSIKCVCQLPMNFYNIPKRLFLEALVLKLL